MMMMMTKGLMVDENLSILTCASGEISASSGIRNEADDDPLYSQLSSALTNQQPPSSKKKRNLPGNPDPEAEVIVLSPKTLMATNRFLCEICKKGFKRDQNLQLHRRGHNLPWKLKQRSNKEVKKKVYVCPETTCVHNHPSRALGDLTGIKKHFSRKHGEKKWKCEKCSKHYAVQSDWKAHSKICGTREYRCDCGTLFSRRDSFITHRAFCDALAHESTAVTSSTMAASSPLLPSQSQFQNVNLLHSLHPFSVKREQEHHLYSQVPSNWLPPQTPSLSCNNNIPPSPINPGIVSSFSTAIDDSNDQSVIIVQNHQQNQTQNPNPTSVSPLLTTLQAQNELEGSNSISLMFSSCPGWETMLNNNDNNRSFNGGHGHGLAPNLDQNKSGSESAPLFHPMMSFEEALNGILLNRIIKDENKGGRGGGGGGDGNGNGDFGETRDFLGLRGLDDMNSSSSTYDLGVGLRQNHTQTTFWLN